ncbi:MAG: hypothetical protein Athens041674_597 [Parcubacteria group bacterium Athens0416_74]|nr:MAG: hypothetical protein Athens041674_597 [Parcubacteria group bacterium Athens0416_74]
MLAIHLAGNGHLMLTAPDGATPSDEQIQQAAARICPSSKVEVLNRGYGGGVVFDFPDSSPVDHARLLLHLDAHHIEE